MSKRLLGTLSLLLLLAPAAFAAPRVSKPRAEVVTEPELATALPAAVRDGLKNTEYGPWELGAAFVVGQPWQIERAAGGVTIGRSKEVDALTRVSPKKCYVLHMRVRQEFDGRDYVNAYKAWLVVLRLDGMDAERHAIDCADYRAP